MRLPFIIDGNTRPLKKGRKPQFTKNPAFRCPNCGADITVKNPTRMLTMSKGSIIGVIGCVTCKALSA